MNNVFALYNESYSVHVCANVSTSFSTEIKKSIVDSTACINPLAAVTGNVRRAERVMVAPAVSVWDDEVQSMWIGDDLKIQDCVVIHALKTHIDDKLVKESAVEVNGDLYRVHIGERVSLAHQFQVHEPAKIGHDTFIGMQSLAFRAIVGNNCVVESKALVMEVNVPDGSCPPAGALITTQEQADNLPTITNTYPFKSLNDTVVHVDQELTIGYQQGESQSTASG